MMLQVDIGNTNIRWRLCEEGGLISSGSSPHSGGVEYDKVFAEFQAVPDGVQVVTVVLGEKERFEAWSADHWGLTPCFAEVSHTCAGVTNGYDEVGQMGADRWLAMIAAYGLARHDCLVVDSGSACTVDLILSDGLHLGGYIVPGSKLMKDALFRDTDRVKLSAIDYAVSPSAGRSTEQAVASGLQLMLLGLVVMALDELLREGARRPYIYITGGGGDNLSRLLEDYLSNGQRLSEIESIIVKPDLVFDGLSLACE